MKRPDAIDSVSDIPFENTEDIEGEFAASISSVFCF